MLLKGAKKCIIVVRPEPMADVSMLTLLPAKILRCRRANVVALLLSGAAVLLPSIADAQQYLQDERPVATTLDGVPSSFENYGEPVTPPDAGVLIPKTFGLFGPTDEWLQNASLYIKPRFYYRHRDEGDGNVLEAFAGGGSIEAESGWLFDTFNIGVSAFTSQHIFGDQSRDGTLLLQEAQGGYAVLGHAFLQARYRSTTAHLYRQEIDIPFLNRNDARMTPNTFEGYLVTTEDPFSIDGLKYGIGHVTKVKGLTSEDFVPLSELAGVEHLDRGVSVIGARYEVSERGLLGATNQYGWDMFNTFYGQGELTHKIPATDITARTALQLTDQRSVGDELLGSFDTQMYGAMMSFELKGFLATLGVTTTDEGGAVLSPWGGDPAFNSVMVGDFTRAGEDSWRVGLAYDFSQIGLRGFSANANYVQGNTPDSGPVATPDQNEWNLTVDYKPTPDFLKNLWLRVRVGENELEGERTREEFRIIINYSIPF